MDFWFVLGLGVVVCIWSCLVRLHQTSSQSHAASIPTIRSEPGRRIHHTSTKAYKSKSWPRRTSYLGTYIGTRGSVQAGTCQTRETTLKRRTQELDTPDLRRRVRCQSHIWRPGPALVAVREPMPFLSFETRLLDDKASQFLAWNERLYDFCCFREETSRCGMA